MLQRFPSCPPLSSRQTLCTPRFSPSLSSFFLEKRNNRPTTIDPRHLLYFTTSARFFFSIFLLSFLLARFLSLETNTSIAQGNCSRYLNLVLNEGDGVIKRGQTELEKLEDFGKKLNLASFPFPDFSSSLSSLSLRFDRIFHCVKITAWAEKEGQIVLSPLVDGSRWKFMPSRIVACWRADPLRFFKTELK